MKRHVKVRGEDREQQRDQPPPRHTSSSNRPTRDAQPDLDHTTDPDELSVQRQIGRHDPLVERRVDEVVDPDPNEEEAEGTAGDMSRSAHDVSVASTPSIAARWANGQPAPSARRQAPPVSMISD